MLLTQRLTSRHYNRCTADASSALTMRAFLIRLRDERCHHFGSSSRSLSSDPELQAGHNCKKKKHLSKMTSGLGPGFWYSLACGNRRQVAGVSTGQRRGGAAPTDRADLHLRSCFIRNSKLSGVHLPSPPLANDKVRNGAAGCDVGISRVVRRAKSRREGCGRNARDHAGGFLRGDGPWVVVYWSWMNFKC